MKSNITRFTGFTLAAMLGVGSALAVPARQVYKEVEQPDGSTVTLMLKGDEYFHYYQTSDGYIVTENADGWYKFVGNDGLPTEMQARNVDERNSEYLSKLSAIQPETAFNNLRNKVESTSKWTQYRLDRTDPSRGLNRINKASSFQPKWDNRDGHFLREFPCEGDQKVLIILVNFTDKKWSFSSDPGTEMSNMLEQPGYSNYDCTGSAYDYFFESSGGVFTPSFDVYGPVELPMPMSYYGGNDSLGNDQNPYMMVVHACQALDSEVNFADYDRDGDGVVDNIYVFYAGYGENEGGGADTVWPHSWDVRYAGDSRYVFDNVQIGHYACSNELNSRNKMTGIGTFCHEFGHVLGLPDLYATSYSGALEPGNYTIMCSGSYNNDGRTPPLYSGYERYALEWQAPFSISKEEDINMFPLSQDGNFYKMTISSSRPTEYFLFENRQNLGFDRTLPSHGMLIWHIDYKSDRWASNTVNNVLGDECVVLAGGGAFPDKTGLSTFTGSTYPAFANKSGTKTTLPITNIENRDDGMVAFRVGNGANENSDYNGSLPVARVESVTSDSFTLSFSAPGQSSAAQAPSSGSHYVSVVYSAFDDYEEVFMSNYLEGYTLAEVNPGEKFTVSGLQPGTQYKVIVYKDAGTNVSEKSFKAYTAAETVAESRTLADYSNLDVDGALISWNAVEGADHYLLTVATREQKPSTENLTADFTGKKLPSGWDYLTIFSSEEGTYGQSAPSMYFSERIDYIVTGYYGDKEIESVEMWTKKSADAPLTLDIYSVSPEGCIDLIASGNDFSTNGKIVKFSDLPDEVHSLAFMLRGSKGMDTSDVKTRLYVDDIKLVFKGETVDSPVGGYNEKPVYATSQKVEGLNANTDYVAYVKVHDGSVAGLKSNTVKFTTGDPAGIEDVVSDAGVKGFYVSGGTLYCKDAEMAFDVYSIDGTPVAKNVKGQAVLPSRGVFVVIFDGHALKVLN